MSGPMSISAADEERVVGELARELDALAADSAIVLAAGFVDRIMAVVALEPLPQPARAFRAAVLAGRLERRGAKFFAHLLGRSHTTVNRFEGEMEGEKAVESQGGGFSGGIWSVRFVLSTNSDCSLFLKE